MKVTVAICTWNRADLLEKTLAEMHKLRIPVGVEWELLIVNNNCTDDTDGVIASHSAALPLRPLFEAKQGQSYARNLAIEEAQGDLLIWTDDDVLVNPDWLENYITASNDNPSCSFFGGKVAPWYEKDPPQWLSNNLTHFGRALALRDLGSDVRPLAANEKIVGANMGFRREAINQYRYDSRLGRQGAKLAGCEDHELVDRMRADGHTGLWVGNATVRHFIPQERMTLDFIRKWWAEQAGLYVTRFPSSRPGHGRVPRWLRRKHAESILKQWCYYAFKPSKWAETYLETAWLEGLIDASRQEIPDDSYREQPAFEG